MKLDGTKQYQNQEKSTKFKKEQLIGEINISTDLKDKWTSNTDDLGKELSKKKNKKAQQRKKKKQDIFGKSGETSVTF